MAKEKICGIYQIKNNINNKVYIGQSCDIYTRWQHHLGRLNAGKHHSEHLQKSWDKYGSNNFSFEILEKCDPEQIDDRERFYIEKYNSTNSKFGYNLESGGSLYKTHSNETRKKISEGNKGKICSEESKKRMSEAQKIAQKGKKLSDETKQKIGVALKGRVYSQETIEKFRELHKRENLSDETIRKISEAAYKKVKQLTTDGVVINIFDAIKLAEEATGINHSHISSVCKGKRKTAGGYIWEYC